jgi:hypothetical protein
MKSIYKLIVKVIDNETAAQKILILYRTVLYIHMSMEATCQ